jgi:O-antigen ligase
MNNLPDIKYSLANKVTFYHLLAFLLTLPFDRFYSQLVFISLVLHSMITVEKKQLRGLFRKETLLLQSVFLLTLIATAWSVYRNNAFGIWEKQLSIFLFPMVFKLTNVDLKKHRQQLLTGFALTCTIVVIYLYVDAFRIIAYYKFSPGKLFTPIFLNHNFSKPVGIHATYLSLYIAVSIIALLTFLFTNDIKRRTRILYASCIIILSAGLLQLASRSVLIAFLVVVNCILPWFLHSRIQRIRFLSASMFVSAIVLFCIIKTDSLNLRLVQGLKDDVTASSLKYSAADPRAKRWELALDLARRSPVIGYGTGAEIPMLKDAYFGHKFYDSYLNDLNAHNQYLSFLLKGGLIALAVYLFTLFYCFRLAIRKKDPLFIGFMVLIFIAGLSENILDVNKGIFFYAFFLSFFVCSHLEPPLKSTARKQSGNQRRASHVFLYKKHVTQN